MINLSSSSGAPIVSSATFNGETLASFGFTQTSGVLGTWTLNGTTESIQVFLGAPAAAAVPGPMPPQLGTLLGVAVSVALGAGIACGGPGVVCAVRHAGGGGALAGAVA